MRTVKKEATVVTYECQIYDRETKTETALKFSVVEGFENFELTVNQVILEKKEIGRKECIFELSPEQFFRNATCINKEK